LVVQGKSGVRAYPSSIAKREEKEKKRGGVYVGAEEIRTGRKCATVSQKKEKGGGKKGDHVFDVPQGKGNISRSGSRESSSPPKERKGRRQSGLLKEKTTKWEGRKK